jgi:hypothetical protein
MNENKIKQLIKEQLKSMFWNRMNEENQPENGLSGAAHLSVGSKTVRVVIEGDNIEEKVNKILDILKRQDKDNTIQFFPATGKLVGYVAKSRLVAIKRDLKPLDVKISEKTQSKSLKKS